MKRLFASIAIAALPAAALSQSPAVAGSDWTVSGGAEGCIAHTTLPQGHVVSVLAGAGQPSLLFLIQNQRWSALEDGDRHQLAVQLDGQSPWEFEAIARTELDSDGPGLLFQVPPGEQEGARFLAEFARAGGMSVGEGGRSLASLRLSGGNTAMTALAQCMAKMWGGASAMPTEPAANARKVAL